jgi:hypothetical protein
MRNYEITHNGDGGPMRLRAADTGRVLAVISADEARQLWINLGAALGLGTSSLTVKHVRKASSLKPLAKRQKKLPS